MNRLLLKWIVVTLTVMAIPHLISGIKIDSLGTALALALVLGLFNIVLKPDIDYFSIHFGDFWLFFICH
ncbi:hypothetical protein EBT16_12045 [bacterium]|nr:hypothetical protein [bacterium]